MTKKSNLILLAIVLIYCLTYLGLRTTHVIVHRAIYITDSQGILRTEAHFVQSGDPDEGEDQSASTAIRNIFIAFVYLPALTAERMYWYATVPLHSEWPYPLREEAESETASTP